MDKSFEYLEKCDWCSGDFDIQQIRITFNGRFCCDECLLTYCPAMEQVNR